MPFLGSLFNCWSNDNNDNNDDECIRRIERLESRFNLIEQKMNIDIKRLEEKIDTKFDMLNMKLDNILMIMNTHNI